MIFITLGSQKFQFNRLLKYIDELLEEQIFQNVKVYAQVGYSTYLPKNFEYKDFLSRDEFQKLINDSEILITHGGTGAIVTGLKLGRKVFAMPRLRNFDEHVDNHQIEIVDIFYKNGYIEKFSNKEELKELLKKHDSIKNNKIFQSNTEKYLELIKNII